MRTYGRDWILLERIRIDPSSVDVKRSVDDCGLMTITTTEVLERVLWCLSKSRGDEQPKQLEEINTVGHRGNMKVTLAAQEPGKQAQTAVFNIARR